MAALLKLAVFTYLLSQCLCYAFDGRVNTKGRHRNTLQHMHSIRLSSLFPSSVCSPSSKDVSKSSLTVVHRRGPCFKPNGEKAKSLSQSQAQAETLLQDQSRVKSIHLKLSKISSSSGLHLDKLNEKGASTKLPAKEGSVVGSGNYIVAVGIGTPKRKLSLIFDTGSDLTWTQCRPCAGSCYQQKEKIFDPKSSRSYTNVSCTSRTCSSLISATGNVPRCTASKTCVYGIQYGDSSFSVGFFAQETLTLTSKDVFPQFLFGCGQDNQGLFRGAAGLLGLGRHNISFVFQTASKYKKIFSYCLPSSSSSTGHLTFGAGVSKTKSVKFTPLSSAFQGSSFYGLDMMGISVAGQLLPIATTVFSTPGTIIDSGTVITRLPPDAYNVLKEAFVEFMSEYPRAPGKSILDTCFDFSNFTTVTIPKISFFFRGDVVVSIDQTGIVFPISVSQVCLAFAGNSDPGEVGIIGNVQQQALEVVYDVAGGMVGFAPGACT